MQQWSRKNYVYKKLTTFSGVNIALNLNLMGHIGLSEQSGAQLMFRKTAFSHFSATGRRQKEEYFVWSSWVQKRARSIFPRTRSQSCEGWNFEISLLMRGEWRISARSRKNTHNSWRHSASESPPRQPAYVFSSAHCLRRVRARACVYAHDKRSDGALSLIRSEKHKI
jgi:hypothetical protein